MTFPETLKKFLKKSDKTDQIHVYHTGDGSYVVGFRDTFSCEEDHIRQEFTNSEGALLTRLIPWESVRSVQRRRMKK